MNDAENVLAGNPEYLCDGCLFISIKLLDSHVSSHI